MPPTDRFSGEETFAATPEKLFTTLTDLKALAGSMPDVQSSEVVDDRTVRAVVRPGFSFLRGTMKVTVTLTDSEAPRRAVMRTSASGIGVGMEIEAKMTIEPHEGGKASRLLWEAAVLERKGLMSAVPSSLIQAAAEKTIRDGWTSLRKRVEG